MGYTHPGASSTVREEEAMVNQPAPWCSGSGVLILALRCLYLVAFAAIPVVAIFLMLGNSDDVGFSASTTYAIAFLSLTPAPFIAYVGVLKHNPSVRLAYVFTQCSAAASHRQKVRPLVAALPASTRFLASTLKQDLVPTFNPLTVDELKAELVRIMGLSALSTVLALWLMNAEFVRIVETEVSLSSLSIPNAVSIGIHVFFSITWAVLIAIVSLFVAECFLLRSLATVVKGRIRLGTLRDADVIALYHWYARVFHFSNTEWGIPLNATLASLAFSLAVWMSTVTLTGCPSCDLLQSMYQLIFIAFNGVSILAVLLAASSLTQTLRSITSEIQQLAIMRRSVGIDTALTMYVSDGLLDSGFKLLGVEVTPGVAAGYGLVMTLTLGLLVRLVV